MSEQDPTIKAALDKFGQHIGSYKPMLENSDIANGQRMEMLFGKVMRRIKNTEWRSWNTNHWSVDDGGTAHLVATVLRDYINNRDLAEAVSLMEAPMHEEWNLTTGGKEPMPIKSAMDAVNSHPRKLSAWLSKGGSERIKWFGDRLKAESKDTIVKDLMADAAYMATDAGINAAVRQFGRRITASPEDFNQVRTKFAFQNGEIDTRTGTFSPGHNPEDLNTRVSPCAYIPDAKGPLWTGYLGSNIVSRAERTFIQMCMGYAMSGDGNQKIILMMYSAMSDTGKSIFVAVMKAFFGNGYATSLAEDTIVQRNNRDGGRDPDRMALRDKRLSIVSEMDPKKQPDVRFIKQYTGGDEVSTRDNHAIGGNKSWTGEGLMLVTTNHLVHVNVEDPAFWERMMLVEWKVPFHRMIPGPDGVNMIPNPARDEQLADKIIGRNGFHGEMEYVGVWVVEGLRMYIKAGRKIVPPRSVINAIAKYRDQSDTVKLWLQDALNEGHVIDDDNTSGSVSHLHKIALEWGRTNKVAIPSNSKGEFTNRLKKLGYKFGPLLAGHAEKERFKTSRRVHGLGIPDQIKVQFKLDGQ